MHQKKTMRMRFPAWILIATENGESRRDEYANAEFLQDNLYRVWDLSPFVWDIADWDIVHAELGDDGVLTYSGLATKMGNGSVFVMTTSPQAALELAEKLRHLDCVVEGMIRNQGALLTVSTRRETEKKAVESVLDEYQEKFRGELLYLKRDW